MMVNGVCLPEGEIHFKEALETLAREGKSACYPALIAAMQLVDCRRRCIDIGAHVGLWSRWLVDLFEQVEAFEPVLEHARLFRQNVPAFNCVLHRVALGEQMRVVGMKTCPGDSGRAHVSSGNDVEMLPLDAFYFDKVDLIKIDVEGYELAVVRGAEQTLKACKPIVVIEQRGCEMTNFGETQRDQALVWLVELGMSPVMRIGHDHIMGWR